MGLLISYVMNNISWRTVSFLFRHSKRYTFCVWVVSAYPDLLFEAERLQPIPHL